VLFLSLRQIASLAGPVVLAIAVLVAMRRLPRSPRGPLPGSPFAERAFAWALVAVLLLHVAFVGAITAWPSLERDLYTVGLAWPLRVFAPRFAFAHVPDVFAALLGLAAVVAIARRAARPEPVGPGELWLVGTLLLLVLNASQGGFRAGLVDPLTDPAHTGEIYDEAAALVADPVPLGAFDEPETVRAWKSPHAKSHPFLPIVAMGAARRAGMDLLPIASFLVALSSLAPLFARAAFSRLRGVRDATAGRLALLLAVLPAVNVYGATSLEGPLLTLATATAAAFAIGTASRRLAWIAVSGAVFALAAAWSFGAVWIAGALPFLGMSVERGYLRRPGRRLVEAVTFALPSLAAYVLLRTQDYDYAKHFVSVARSGMGVHWLATPLVAVESRLQNVAEVFLLGPPLLVGGWVHVASRLRRGGMRGLAPALAAAGIPLGVLFLFTPIYSEFARGWLFVYPFLLAPLAPFLRRTEGAGRFLAITLAWTWAWQVFGHHSW
jgi:hypothetical protein